MNARKQSIDKTYLSIDNAEERGFIHRDYIAHVLRWSHVIKRLYERKCYQSARILDIGCGRELPFAKTLYSSKLIPAMYFGVDAGPINDEAADTIARTCKFPHKVWERTNFLEISRADVETKIFPDGDGEHSALPNIVVCMEVLEHVEPAMMMAMLEHMKSLTSDDCRYFISTPCWNRTDCAANHVNEMLHESLGAAFERHGFLVENVYGTFASIRDYESVLQSVSISWHDLFCQLREYYDTNLLSCIFAPLFPAQSRNCLWELSKVNDQTPAKRYKFPPIADVQKPWSSSEKWIDMQL